MHVNISVEAKLVARHTAQYSPNEYKYILLDENASLKIKLAVGHTGHYSPNQYINSSDQLVGIQRLRPVS